MRYRSKPSEIEAVKWTGDNLEEVEAFGVKFRYGPEALSQSDPLKIKAGKDGAQGYVEVPVGHWIVRQPGDHSDHWPVAPEYFASKYEAAAGFALNPPSYEDPEETVTLTCHPCNVTYQFTGDAGSCAEEAGEFRLGHGGCTT